MTDYAKDFAKFYMELLPKDSSVNQHAHRTIAWTAGAVLGLILTKFKYDLLQELKVPVDKESGE